MPFILVVDDSEVDRRVIGGLLSKEVDWLMIYAENGKDALSKMRDVTPDLVITDMLMPEMNGLELVQAARKEFERVPVILVTGEGSEELASEALRRGAASYVPKSQLNEGLLETVEQVLSLGESNRNLERLMQRSINIRHKFQFDNDPAMFPVFIEFVQKTIDLMKFCDAADRLHVAVALEEALLNAVYHGNLKLPVTELPRVRQQLHADGKSKQIDDRRGESPYKERSILIGFDITFERAQFVIRDQGSGFDTKARDVSSQKELSNEAGRGLVLIHSFMDEVEFNDSGNEIRMVVRRKPTKESAETE